MGKKVELLENHTSFHANFLDIAHIMAQFYTIDNDLTLMMFFQPVDGADKS